MPGGYRIRANLSFIFPIVSASTVPYLKHYYIRYIHIQQQLRPCYCNSSIFGWLSHLRQRSNVSCMVTQLNCKKSSPVPTFCWLPLFFSPLWCRSRVNLQFPGGKFNISAVSAHTAEQIADWTVHVWLFVIVQLCLCRMNKLGNTLKFYSCFLYYFVI